MLVTMISTTWTITITILMMLLLLGGTHGNDVVDVGINLPHVVPPHTDSYLCVPYQLPAGDRYIVRYEPQAEMNTVHHMLLYGCDVPFKPHGYWDCLEKPLCEGNKQTILYAWAKNAPGLEMPEDTGMYVGGESGIKFLVLQLHYLHVDQFTNGRTDHSGVTVSFDKRPKDRLAGIYLIGQALSLTDYIPPHHTKWHMDSGCYYPHDTPGPTFHVFRFRVHTHSLGVVVTGYRVRDGRWTLIGRGDPQAAQSFNPTSGVVAVVPGDELMMRCTYDSTSRDRTTFVGPTHKDEMCNLYAMYYYDARKHGEIKTFPCVSNRKLLREFKSTMKYPEDSDRPKDQSLEDNTSKQGIIEHVLSSSDELDELARKLQII